MGHQQLLIAKCCLNERVLSEQPPGWLYMFEDCYILYIMTINHCLIMLLQDTTLTMSLLVSIYGSGALNIKNVWSLTACCC